MYIKEDLVIPSGLVKNLLRKWEAVLAAHNVSWRGCISGMGIQSPVCPHKISVSLERSIKFIKNSLESLLNLGWLHRFRDPLNPDDLPPPSVIKVLQMPVNEN